MIAPMDGPLVPRCASCHAPYAHGKPFVHAPTCGQGRTGEGRSVSPTVPSARAMPVGGSKPRRDGSHAEDALYAALRLNWHELGADSDALWPEWCDSIRKCWIRQYPWGAYLSPPRRFSADAGFPVARLLVEVEGQAHSIKARRKGDVLKSQLADAAGWKIVRLLPEQVRDGSAVALIARALDTHAAGAAGRQE